MKTLIDNKDYPGIKLALSKHPGLANEGIPSDAVNTVKAHPLHRICDGVFSRKYSDEEAVSMARIFLEHGANVNGYTLTYKLDTPLIAAASLNADRVALLFIERGADIHHAGTHGGTALHWAAWCGRDSVVRRLVQAGAEINKRCSDFKATPLFWAVKGFKNEPDNELHSYLECVKILLQSGADKTIPNGGGTTILDLLTDKDVELKDLLNS